MKNSVFVTKMLEKYPGKGGWTYAAVPEIAQDKSAPFGWVTVSGSIDSYPLHKIKLMPMGNGQLFLPVKAEIRKKIKKQAGDWVKIHLFVDSGNREITTELLECFKNEPSSALRTFQSLPDGDQKKWLDRIYESKSQETKAQRIIELMDWLVSLGTH